MATNQCLCLPCPERLDLLLVRNVFILLLSQSVFKIVNQVSEPRNLNLVHFVDLVARRQATMLQIRLLAGPKPFQLVHNPVVLCFERCGALLHLLFLFLQGVNLLDKALCMALIVLKSSLERLGLLQTNISLIDLLLQATLNVSLRDVHFRGEHPLEGSTFLLYQFFVVRVHEEELVLGQVRRESN